MELDGKQYYFTREQIPGSCAGCAFFGDTMPCKRARGLQNCAQDKIIWKRDNGTGEIPEQERQNVDGPRLIKVGGKSYRAAQGTQPLSCLGCAFRDDREGCKQAMHEHGCMTGNTIWKLANGTGEILKGKEQEVKEQMVKLSYAAKATARLSAATVENDAVSGDVSALSEQEKKCLEKYPHYFKDIRHLNILDIYRVLDLFSTGDAALDHAAKKILAAGKRGAKDKTKDIKEAIDALQRKLWMLEEDEKCGQ